MKLYRLVLTLALAFVPLLARAQSVANPGPPDVVEEAPATMIAQQPQSDLAPPQADIAPPPGKPMVKIRTGGQIGGVVGPVRDEPLRGGEFGPGGAWWKSSEIVSKLQLSEEQVRKISQTFLDHKLKLIDLQADLDKQELRLQPLLDIDQPDESRVSAQIDLITASRGKLEKENAMMMLDIRRWLSVEQWKKLKSLEATEPGPRNVVIRGNAREGGARLRIEGFPSPLPEDVPVTEAH